MENLFGKTLAQCEDIMKQLGEPAYRGKQLWKWLYEKKALSLEECTDLPKKIRGKLEQDYEIFHGKVVKIQEDSGDGTAKYLIEMGDGELVETVFMPYNYGHSICVSSQVGCRMGCDFCASTVGGRVRNLSAGEMLDQIFLIEQGQGVRITNIVLMGMGEPFDNYDNVLQFIELATKAWGIGQRKITLSTCGIIPRIEDFAKENLQVNLAISLHTPFQDKRAILMPISKPYPVQELLKVCNIYFTTTKRRVSYEYALIDGFNDRQEDINEIVRLFKGHPHHINLIPLNPVSTTIYKGSQNVNFFSHELKKRGINCTIRKKMGREIEAACGQLKLNAKMESKTE